MRCHQNRRGSHIAMATCDNLPYLLLLMLWLGSVDSSMLNPLQLPEDNDYEPPKTQVDLFYGITLDRKAIITCEVNVSSKSQVDGNAHNGAELEAMSALYLICPQVPTAVCYMDCTPSCVISEKECTIPRSISSVIEDCTYDRVSNNRLRVNYVINMEALDKTGQWNCDYRGQRATRALDLRAIERPSSSIPTPSPLTTSTSADKSDVIVSTPPTIRKVSIPPNKSEFVPAVTQPELVIILLAVLGTSLILNVILSIRCALTKNYLDNMSRGKNDHCLSQLLCLRTKADHSSTSTSQDPMMPPAASMRADYTTTSILVDGSSPNFIQYSSGLDSPTEAGSNHLMFYQNPSLAPSNVNGSLPPLYHPVYMDPSMAVTKPMETISQADASRMNQFYPSTPLFHRDSIGPINGTRIAPIGANAITRDSLTGSYVLTNDSNSCTDGIVTGNPLTTVLPSKTHANGRSNQSSDVMHQVTPPQSITQLSVDRESDNPEGRLSRRFPPVRMLQSYHRVHSASPESFEDEQLSNRRSNFVNPAASMTPLVVRFPSGESGLLICPNRSTQEAYSTGSLSRQALRRSQSNRPRKPYPFRQTIRRGGLGVGGTNEQGRNVTSSTLVTTDTESESGGAEFNRAPITQSHSQYAPSLTGMMGLSDQRIPSRDLSDMNRGPRSMGVSFEDTRALHMDYSLPAGSEREVGETQSVQFGKSERGDLMPVHVTEVDSCSVGMEAGASRNGLDMNEGNRLCGDSSMKLQCPPDVE